MDGAYLYSQSLASANRNPSAPTIKIVGPSEQGGLLIPPGCRALGLRAAIGFQFEQIGRDGCAGFYASSC